MPESKHAIRIRASCRMEWKKVKELHWKMSLLQKRAFAICWLTVKSWWRHKIAYFTSKIKYWKRQLYRQRTTPFPPSIFLFYLANLFLTPPSLLCVDLFSIEKRKLTLFLHSKIASATKNMFFFFVVGVGSETQ